MGVAATHEYPTLQKEELHPLLVILKDCETRLQSPSSHRKLSTSYLVWTLNLEFIKTLKAPVTEAVWTKSCGTRVSGHLSFLCCQLLSLKDMPGECCEVQADV